MSLGITDPSGARDVNNKTAGHSSRSSSLMGNCVLIQHKPAKINTQGLLNVLIRYVCLIRYLKVYLLNDT